MTKLPFSLLLILLILIDAPTSTHALGSATTLAVTYGASPAVCGIISSTPNHSITCFANSSTFSVLPNVSFSTVSGGVSFLCALRSSSTAFLCWDSPSNFADPQRVYNNSSSALTSLSVGSDQICAIHSSTSTVECWRGNRIRNPTGSTRFSSISSGVGFSCGILAQNGSTHCWGSVSDLANWIQTEFANLNLSSIVCGGAHACGMTTDGKLVCKGENSSGQLNVPDGQVPFEYSGVSLGPNHTCGVRERNGSVICWGGEFGFYNNATESVSFESVVSGSNFSCGIIKTNFSVACWGPGWDRSNKSGLDFIPFSDPILPGPCVEESSCGGCGILLDSQRLCSGSEVICETCGPNGSVLIPPVAPPSSSRSKTLTTGLLVFAIVGSVGAFSGICTVIYCLWTGVCFGKKKVHNSVQPTITRNGSNNNGGIGTPSSNNHSGIIISRSSTIRRQGSRAMRRQRSGTSSKHADRAEEFSLAELVAATNGFAFENKIGAGSFGIVYKGKLEDGREVAIKRGEVGNKAKKFQEKESAFESELAFLSRVHHKHLVGLVGYCEDGDERLLVYEYMKNGALYDHLHDKNNLEKSSSVINSWRIRIKIALDAARGIEYLHNYAVPPIIHRDIKSSNILIDASWTARVSDFGLSMMGPDTERGQFRPMKAAGTVGYIDPEYYGLNVLTAKSDVYGFGVVLLEILTGRKAIYKGDDEEETPTSLVDFAVPKIMVNELVKILDPRVGPPDVNEAEAIELVAFTAMHCVHLEGKDRPTMMDIVSNLERALSLCEGSHGSISSGTVSIVSE